MRRLGSFAEAAESYERAFVLAANASERRFLDGRLREVRQRLRRPTSSSR